MRVIQIWRDTAKVITISVMQKQYRLEKNENESVGQDMKAVSLAERPLDMDPGLVCIPRGIENGAERIDELGAAATARS